MLTSFFSKSKPIHLFMVFAITLLALVIALFKLENETFTFWFILKQIVNYLVCIASILVLSFIISKNELTLKNSFGILIFGLFLISFSSVFSNSYAIFSNFFILLALRRLMSIRSKKLIKSKLFDASLWIAIATLFNFWSILFFALIFTTLIVYLDKQIRHWLIPFLGFVTVSILAITYSLITTNIFLSFANTNYTISLDFSAYNSTKLIVAISVFLSFSIWALLFYIKQLQSKKGRLRPSFRIVLIWILIAFTVAFITPIKNTSEFVFLFAPLAIVLTNYIETIEEKWFKELFFAAFIIMPIILLVL